MTMRIDGRLIREMRIQRSWSQEKLAEIIGVNLRTIQRIETKGAASLATRGALADAFGVKPEELDSKEPITVTASQAGGRRPRWAPLIYSAILVAVGWIVLAFSIRDADPIGLVTPPAIGGMLLATFGFVMITRLTPLGRSRTYAVLAMIGIAMIASPPAWTIQALVTISLWAAFELGIVLTSFRERPRLS